MEKFRKSLVVVSGCAVALATAAGCSSEASPPGASAVRVIEARPYDVDSAPESAASFFMNENVFRGKVVDVLPDVRVVDELPEGASFEAVYTPVRMEVLAVDKGDVQVGSVVTMRAMGGQADGVRYDIVATDKAEFVQGAVFAVFAGEAETLGVEAGPALTPNFLYVDEGSTLRDVTYADPLGEEAHVVSEKRLAALLEREATE